jgi:hypothetical protein
MNKNLIFKQFFGAKLVKADRLLTFFETSKADNNFVKLRI